MSTRAEHQAAKARAALAALFARQRPMISSEEIAADVDGTRKAFRSLFGLRRHVAGKPATMAAKARQHFYAIAGKYGVAVDLEAGSLGGIVVGVKPAPGNVQRTPALATRLPEAIRAELASAEQEERAARAALEVAEKNLLGSRE